MSNLPKSGYDVALSYAGEDGRRYAKALHDLLKNQNMEVYFDIHQRLNNLGDPLPEHIQKIYGGGANLYVIFWSEEHSKRWWPQKELECIRSSVLSTSNQEYRIIFYLLDGTDLPPAFKNFIQATLHDPLESLSETIDKKLIDHKTKYSVKIETPHTYLKGLQNFEKTDRDCFLSFCTNLTGANRFTNSEEAIKLKDSVTKKFVTILYGFSTTGKTSLIKAGLIPLLEEIPSKWTYIYVDCKNCTWEFPHAYENFFAHENLDIESIELILLKIIDHLLQMASTGGVKCLLIVDHFEECEAGVNLSLFLEKVHGANKSNHSKISILLICQEINLKNDAPSKSDPKLVENLIQEKFSSAKFFARHAIQPLEFDSAENYLKNALQISEEECGYFSEMFNLLKRISKKKIDRNSIYPPYLQIFGTWWESVSLGSRMTPETWNSFIPDGADMSEDIILEDFWKKIKDSKDQNVVDMWLFYSVLVGTTCISQDSLEGMRFFINESIMTELVKYVKNDWFGRLIEKIEGYPGRERINLVEDLKGQMTNVEVKKIINEIYSANDNLSAPQLIRILSRSQDYLHSFLSCRNKPHENVKTLIYIFIHFHCGIDARYLEFNISKSTPSTMLSEFYSHIAKANF
jgi:hypothetical protein